MIADPVAIVVEVLLLVGLEPDGQTATQTVRVPTVRAPVFGGLGGELRAFGGRRRYRKPDSALRVTVGPHTVCVYTVVEGREPVFLATYQTRSINLDELRAVLNEQKETP